MEKSNNNILDIEFDAEFETKLKLLNDYESSLKSFDQHFSYGTSGFRFDESLLDKLTFRVAIVTCLFSQVNEGLPMGIMITASHNKYTDNGIKIAGLAGESISTEWEEIYTNLVNCKNLVEGIKQTTVDLLKLFQGKNKYFFRDYTPVVCLAHDTRRSCDNLIKITMDCLNIFNAKYNNYSVQTTPALQFLTLLNQMQIKKVNFVLSQFQFVNSQEYWNFLKGVYTSFNIFYDKFYANSLKNKSSDKYERKLLVDCANGAAGYHYENIAKILDDSLQLKFINTNYKTHESLNKGSGAEHMHKDRVFPTEYENSEEYVKNVSFDGDVDRIIYFINQGDKALMVDGDHLTCLYSLTIKNLVSKLSKSLQNKFYEQVKIGIVCTAYSNGAFMEYVKNLGFELIIARTGIKNLHHEAKRFDLACYFESNGHGTVYISDDLLLKIEKLNCFIESSTDSQTLELLTIFLSMFNKTTGDSLSALIATEASLKLNNMTLNDLYYIYTELESVHSKLVVNDKNIFVPNEDETRLVKPEELQKRIDEVVLKYPNGRCFVRPSGTEDIVRIYSEASTLDYAKRIAYEIGGFIKHEILK